MKRVQCAYQKLFGKFENTFCFRENYQNGEIVCEDEVARAQKRVENAFHVVRN